MPAYRFLLVLLVPALIVGAGTVGYRLIEGWTTFDALYMSVITLTTVGYMEVHPLSHAGRQFTIVLALGGVFSLFYAATAIIGAIVGGTVGRALGRQRMQSKLAQLQDHIVVCGYGRMGRFVCREFAAKGLPFVVIERGETEDAEAPGGLILHGDATSDEVLRRAGVERARSLVTVLAHDADNLYITMSARFLNEKVYIVARAEDEHAEAKLVRAGANRVISPYVLGGHRVAQAVLRPAVVDFIELATRSGHVELQIEEECIAPGSPLAGRAIKESPLRQQLGILVVAIRKASGKMEFNPPGETVMEAGDTLVTLGPQTKLDELAKLASR